MSFERVIREPVKIGQKIIHPGNENVQFSRDRSIFQSPTKNPSKTKSSKISKRQNRPKKNEHGRKIVGDATRETEISLNDISWSSIASRQIDRVS